MKKTLLALSVFLPLTLLLPSATAQRAIRAGKSSRAAAPAAAPAAPRPPAARQAADGKGAEAETAAPGATLDPSRLPKETRPATLTGEGEVKKPMPSSDLDPATLRRLKQQPYAEAAAAPPSHTVQEDGAAKPAAEGAPRPLAPARLRSFAGPHSDEQLDGSLQRPPDTDMAAGPDHVVTVVNSMIAVYSKTGTLVQSNSLATRFGNVCAGCHPFDPRVTYDPTAERWLVLALEQDNTTSRILLSVSQSSDPTGAWWNYSLNGVLEFNNQTTWADYPDLGFDGIPAASGGAVYVTTNQFTFDSGLFRTSMILILPKSSLYSGESLNFWRAYDRRNADGTQAFTLRAAKTYGNPGGQYLINTRNANSYVSVWRIVPTYPPAGLNMTLQTTINIGAYAIPPNARQPGCAATLDTGDNRMYNAVWRNNRLYAAFTEAHDWGGGGGTVSAVRFLKVNTSSNTAELNQTYGSDGLNYSFPAITTDEADNIVLAFARTGSGEYGSIRYTGRLATDTATQGSAMLKGGVQCLTGERFGDYQGVAVDPADGSKVWVYGEWAADTAGANSTWDWGTWVGQVQFGGVSCDYVVSPATNAVGAEAATGSVNVTAGAGCAWSATANAPWLDITSGATGTGSGTVSYTIAANNVNVPRTGTLTIADEPFTVTQAAGACTLSAPLGFGQTATGTLSTADCQATNRSGSYADRYTFTGTAGQPVVISLSSATYDTYLYLFAPNGTLAASDDDGGDGANSRIPSGSGTFTLPATGTYTIEATSFSNGITGSYSLTLQRGCNYSISPTSQSFGSDGGTGGVAVTATDADCAWTAASDSSFVTITSGASGSGSGTVSYSVAANQTTSPRTATLTVAGRSFTVTQAAGICTMSSPLDFGQTATGTLSTTDCRATNRSSSYADRYTFAGTAGQQVAISLSSAAYDTYLYLFAPNGTLAASDDDGGGGLNSRIPWGSGFFLLPATGTYTIEATSLSGGTTGSYSLTLQAGCNASISPASQSFGHGGGTGGIAVTATTGCAWTAASGASFITVTSGASGSGSGTVGYTVAANTSTSPRSGTVTVAELTFTVNQAAAPESFVHLGSTIFGANESARKALVSVTRSGDTSGAASVNYATADGTASRLRDYTQTLGTLTFAPGETTKTVTVFVTNDVFLEPAETFSFALSGASGATLSSPSSATVTITSDDASPGANPVGDAAFSPDFFVGQHYVDFLNREADASGLAFWTNEFTQCGADVACRDVKRVHVSAAFFLSIEFRETGYLAYRLYKAAYGDATSPGVDGTVPVVRLNEFLTDTQRIGQGLIVGAPGWEAQLEANKQAFALEFVQRARFLAAFPATMTPAQFADKLRQNTGAALTQEERDQLVAELVANNTTAGRASVLRRVAEDATLQTNEKNRAFVLMQYYGYLRRNPDDAPDSNFAGWKFWLDKLNEFGGNFVQAEMVQAFITSAEYRQRFGP